MLGIMHQGFPGLLSHFSLLITPFLGRQILRFLVEITK